MASSSDDSEETGITKLRADDEKEEVVVAAAAVLKDSQKKNPVERHRGSNTPSGSDAETDALDKMEKEKRQGREGFRLSLQRERLPQSFSPPQVAENVNGKQSDTTPIIMPLAPPPPPNLNKIQDSCNAD
ncbi:hypothetical protein Bca52824_074477 [Brassica carinata]|uniref:Uncharacterized protein n=1 Tax=Brassica carinata TaxID=52824 RepID=A0A8X7PR62_BRACI|nr:hypothetical protein Bca52824_074477 [Brassica carinata]